MPRHPISQVDKFYRCLIGGGLFPAGWGDSGRLKELMEFHKVMSNRSKVQALIDPYPEVIIQNSTVGKKFQVHNGYLFSPFAKYCPGLLPAGSEICRFEFIVPAQFQLDAQPVAIHMAGTGDQHFWRRRRLLAEPLATENGIASLIMENPFYGSRRPPNQIRSNVRFVSDIFVMGGGLMLESLALLRWLEVQGFGPFCMTGISMGGHMASIGATNYSKPIAIAPCLSWTTASSVFTRGVMTNAINWDTCEKTYFDEPAFRKEIFHNLIHYKLDVSLEAEETDKSKVDKRMPTAKVLWTNPLLLTKWLRALLDFPKNFHNQIKVNLPPLPPFSSFFTNLNNPGKSLFPSLSFSIPTSRIKRQLDTKSQSSPYEGSFHFQGSTSTKDVVAKGSSGQGNPLPKLNNFYNQGDSTTRTESLEFMKRLMDHFTHLSNFEKPIDSELATIISARYDAYVLRDGVKPIEEIWPGCTVRYLETGHVVAYLRHQDEFRKAIRDSLKRHRDKYNPDGTRRYTQPQNS